MSISSFRLPNSTRTAATRAKRLFESIQTRFQKQELRSHEDVRGAVYDAFREAFLHAGEPTFTGGALPADIPRLIEHYKPLIDKIADDLYVSYKEAQALAKTHTSTFNYHQATMSMLDGQIRRAGSTLIDVQLTNDRFLGPVIVAGDDFNDTSRLDSSSDLTLPKADVNPLAGILTLARTRNNSVIDIDNTKITVEPLQNYRHKLYEGQFYGLVGQAVPEGGRFRFVRKQPGEAAKQAIGLDLLRRFSNYVNGAIEAAATVKTSQTSSTKRPTTQEAAALAKQSGSYGGLTAAEWELLASQPFAGNDLLLMPPGQPQEFASGVSDKTTFVDQGATVAERLDARKTMIDGNPDTFWQVEYTLPISGDLSSFQSQISGTQEQPELSGSVASLINQSQRNFDLLDLDIRITIDLGAPKVANWIDLIPMLFDGIEHLKILGARSSVDGQTYEDLSDLQTGSDKKLSRDTNKEVSDEVASATLSPSTSAFSGKGLWVFAPRAIRFLQLDLRQPVPVIAPYQIVVAELTGTVHRRHSPNAVGRRRKSTTTHYNRTVRLSYPESIMVTSGSSDPESVTQTKGLSVTNTEGSRLLTGAAVGQAITGDFIGAGITLGISRLIGRQEGGKTSSSETIAKQWFETLWDKARYAIGIQDIGIWQYEFTEQSEIISIPFKTPGFIGTVALEVDELIPSEYNADQRIQSWIDYFVSMGDGGEWLPIAPLTSRVVKNLEGGQLPGAIHVNSGIPVSERNPGEGYLDLDHKVDTIRFRAILRRPTDLPNSTPALRSYRLLITTQT